jgi:hypothetical protein
MRAAVAVLLFFVGSAQVASAQDPKYECIAESMDAQTLHRAGRLLDARAKSLACARETCPDIVRSHCAHWMTEIVDEIPSLVVRAQTPEGQDILGATVTIDGTPGKLDGRPVEVDPGEHVVAVEAAGRHRKEARVLLAAGERARVVTLALAESSPAAETPPVARRESAAAPREAVATRPMPAGVWVLGGVSATALAAAAFFAIQAQHQYDLVTAAPPTGCSPHCTPQQTATGRDDSLAAYGLLGVGVVAGGAALLWALLPREATKSSAAERWRFGAKVLRGAGMAIVEGQF